MERLTDVCWRNFDPWECCGQDHYCTRGCHDEGGCTKGCIVPRLYARLADYEDFVERWKLTSIEDANRIFRRINALGGTDLMGQYRDLGPINHLRSLVQAEKDGRLVVLPPNAPLTLEELRKLDGEPVWVVGISAINGWNGHWDIFEWSDGKMLFCRSLEEPGFDSYDPTGLLGVAGWRAYRYKPEEDAK